MIEPLHTFLIPRSNPQQSSCGDLNARLHAAATEWRHASLRLTETALE